MTTLLRQNRRTPALMAVALLAGAIAYATLSPAQADHSPADKVAASGSTVEVFDTDDQPVTLLSTSLRTSKPTDLVLQTTVECSITTNVTTVGTDDQSAEATVTVWVEVDGNPVAVAGGDDGEVVFCNRMYRRATDFGDDEESTIETFFDTRSAHGFNWVTLDVGSGIHTVEVKARLEAVATQEAFAKAAVGNRTLVVEPTKMPNDASLS